MVGSLPWDKEQSLHFGNDPNPSIPELDVGPILLTRPNSTHNYSDPTRPDPKSKINMKLRTPTHLDPLLRNLPNIKNMVIFDLAKMQTNTENIISVTGKILYFGLCATF